MKSNWPAWVADFRTYFEHPDSTEAYGDAEKALEAAEEFLSWQEKTPFELHLALIEADISRLEEALLDALAFDSREENLRERYGAEIIHKAEVAGDELRALKVQGDVPDGMFERLFKVGHDVLLKLFFMDPETLDEDLVRKKFIGGT